MKREQPHRLYGNEQGMVAILTVMVLLIVITMITLGFSRLANREQRDTLDRQLSTQAFYAAESGINDAVAAYTSGANGDKNNCSDWGGVTGAFTQPSSVIDADADVSYSCLLVDSAPDNLKYDDIPVNSSQSFPVSSADGTAINSIQISWQASDLASAPNVSGCGRQYPNFSTQGAWSNSGCEAPLLRIDLVRTAGSFTRDQLIDGLFAFELYPRTSGGNSVAFSPANKGVVQGINCNAVAGTFRCNATITGLGSSQYHIKIRPIYTNGDIEVKAFGANGQLELKDAQLEVDATGRANDVLRRIAVRVSINKSIGPDTPGFSIQSGTDVCKKLLVGIGHGESEDPTNCPIPQ